MTTEEKVYIASFNDREFKLFINDLNIERQRNKMARKWIRQWTLL